MVFKYSVVSLGSEQVIIALVQRKVFTSVRLKNELLGYFRTMGHGKKCLLCCLDQGSKPLYYGPVATVNEVKKLNPASFLWQTITI